MKGREKASITRGIHVSVIAYYYIKNIDVYIRTRVYLEHVKYGCIFVRVYASRRREGGEADCKKELSNILYKYIHTRMTLTYTFKYTYIHAETHRVVYVEINV